MQIKRILKKHGIVSLQQAYDYYNEMVKLGYDSKEESYRRACRAAFPIVDNSRIIGESYKEVKENGNIESTINTMRDLKTIEQMADFCNIDTKLYTASKIVSNSWGDPIKPSFQFKVWWTPLYKKNELTPYDACNVFKNLIKDVKIPKIKIKPLPVDKNGTTVIIGLTDSHIGSLVWGDESSAYNQQNYDLKIAEKMINKAIDYYCSYYSTKNIKEFILPIGGDFLDIDNNDNSTINGTIQVVDARPRKIWSVGLRIMKSIIDKLSTIAPIKGLYIPGNHDATVSYYLSCSLDAYYHNNPNVNIDIDPTDRKYIKIGQTLVVITHSKTIGKAIKLETLVDTMSHEARELWGQTSQHEVIVGHYHTERNITIGVKTDITTKDIGSTIVRVLPTLFPNNYWSNASGYNAVQQMQCLEYNNKNIEEIKIYRP